MTTYEKTGEKIKNLQGELVSSIKEIDSEIAKLRTQRQPLADLLRATGFRRKDKKEEKK
jgi:hypothetical protein